MQSSPNSARQTVARFTLIDALRGIAALWVATFHFYGGVSEGFTRPVFWHPLHAFFAHGNAGVEIFFVISGFVIAYSIRNQRVNLRYFGQFMLRRSIRLEPPYWVTIALAVAMLWLSNHIRPDRIIPLPTSGQVLAHIFYLQGILHRGQLVDVFWTLCIEIQFYVSLLILVALAQRIGNTRISLLCVLLPFTVVSLGIHALWIPEPGPWMFKFWYLFQLGAMAYWTSSRELRESDLFIYLSVLVALIAWHPSFSSGIGVLTGVAIYLASKYQLLGVLNYKPLQFLGRRSYSLYLIHPVLGVPFTYFVAHRFFGDHLSGAQAMLCMAMAITVSLLGASLLFWTVEGPSLHLSRALLAERSSKSKAVVYS